MNQWVMGSNEEALLIYKAENDQGRHSVSTSGLHKHTNMYTSLHMCVPSHKHEHAYTWCTSHTVQTSQKEKREKKHPIKFIWPDMVTRSPLSANCFHWNMGISWLRSKRETDARYTHDSVTHSLIKIRF